MIRKTVRNSKGSKRERAKEYLLSRDGMVSDNDVMLAVKCSRRTVSSARQELVRSGKLLPSPFDRQTQAAQELKTEGALELEKELEKKRNAKGQPLSHEEKLKMLAKAARQAEGNQDITRLRDAIIAHTNVESKAVEKETLGPGQPLTDAERLKHTAIIADVAGPLLLARAARQTFDGTEWSEFCNHIDHLKGTISQPQQDSGNGTAEVVLPVKEPDEPKTEEGA